MPVHVVLHLVHPDMDMADDPAAAVVEFDWNERVELATPVTS